MRFWRILFLAACCEFLAGAAAPSATIADAVERGDVARARELLRQKADVNQPQADGTTALHWAMRNDNVELVRALLAEGADVTRTNQYGIPPLALACESGNAVMVEMLLKAGANPNTVLRGGETVLMTAARTGKIAPVKLLVTHGAKVNEKERRGQSAIMWAAAEGHAEVVEYLIQAGADIHAALPDSGFNPLFFAVREGRSEVVKVLLKAGADVNGTMQPRKVTGKGPQPGTTPLILAVENGHFDLAIELVKAGADPNDQRCGFTALHTLTWVRKPNRGDGDDGDPAPIGSGSLSSLQFVRKMAELGADVNARLKNGKSGKAVLTRRGATPFMLAAVTADTAYMKLLKELGANPATPNAENATPLMAAAGVGTMAPTEEAGTEEEVLEAVEYLLSLGADINAVDDNGETVMHGAAYKSLPKVVELLAARGAKIEVWNRKNKYGWTPWRIAQGYRVGNFKPSFETMDALRMVMVAAGVKPPEEATVVSDVREDYAPPKAGWKAPVPATIKP